MLKYDSTLILLNFFTIFAFLSRFSERAETSFMGLDPLVRDIIFMLMLLLHETASAIRSTIQIAQVVVLIIYKAIVVISIFTSLVKLLGYWSLFCRIKPFAMRNPVTQIAIFMGSRLFITYSSGWQCYLWVSGRIQWRSVWI